VIDSLRPVFGGASKRQIQMLQTWQPVIFAGCILLPGAIGKLVDFLTKV
jgi:hypothetical protein